MSERLSHRIRHNRNHRTRAAGTLIKGHPRVHDKVYTRAFAVNAALTRPRSASRTARCGATRRPIRTEDGHQPPCAHTARLSKTLLLAVGAEARASAAIFSIDIHPHHSRKNEGACSQFVISFTAVQKWCVRPVISLCILVSLPFLQRIRCVARCAR